MYREYTYRLSKPISTENAAKASEAFALYNAAMPSPAAVLLSGRPMSPLQSVDNERSDAHQCMIALTGSQESFDGRGILRPNWIGPGMH